jgi:hypothetical protein
VPHEGLDPMELPEPAQWRAGFGGTPGLFDFVSTHASLALALAITRVSWPRFTVVRECVVIAERYDPTTFEQWWVRLDGDVGAIERVVNHLHLWDLFDDESDDSRVEQAFREMAQLVAASWRCALESAFPGRKFEVVVSDDPEDYGPTVTFGSV